MTPQMNAPATQPRDKRAFNAYRHGLAGHVFVIEPGEDRAYRQHCQGYQQSFAPLGAVEIDLVQSVADDRWRLKRAAAMEANLIAVSLNQPDLSENEVIDSALVTSQFWLDQGKDLARLTLYESRIQRRVEKNVALLRQLQQDRREAL
jgi:hypothetical protein